MVHLFYVCVSTITAIKTKVHSAWSFQVVTHPSTYTEVPVGVNGRGLLQAKARNLFFTVIYQLN